MLERISQVLNVLIFGACAWIVVTSAPTGSSTPPAARAVPDVPTTAGPPANPGRTIAEHPSAASPVRTLSEAPSAEPPLPAKPEKAMTLRPTAGVPASAQAERPSNGPRVYSPAAPLFPGAAIPPETAAGAPRGPLPR